MRTFRSCAKNELTTAFRGPALGTIAARLRCRRHCRTLGGIEHLGELAHRSNQLLVLLGDEKLAAFAQISRHCSHHSRRISGFLSRRSQSQRYLRARLGERVLVALLASFA